MKFNHNYAINFVESFIVNIEYTDLSARMIEGLIVKLDGLSKRINGYGAVSYNKVSHSAGGNHVIINPGTSEQQVYSYIDKSGVEEKLQRFDGTNDVWFDTKDRLHIQYLTSTTGYMFTLFDIFNQVVEKITDNYELSVTCKKTGAILKT